MSDVFDMSDASETVFIPDFIMVDIGDIRPNEWNPNELDPDTFNELTRNIQEEGFLQPIVVAPLPEGADYKFEIIDGEHRYDVAVLLDMKEVPVAIKEHENDVEISIGDKRRFLTVKMDKLRGKFNQKKFTVLVKDLMERHTFEDVAQHLAFTDPTELEQMIKSTRESLPTDEMKRDFDKVKEEISTVDDLTTVLNRLFTKYGDTVPYNYMILDFGGRQHIWVRVPAKQFRYFEGRAREVTEHGVTFDSVLMLLLEKVNLPKFVKKYQSRLEKVILEKDDIDSVLKE